MAVDFSERYLKLAKGLLPKGKAWVRRSGTVLEKLFQAASDELARLHSRSLDLLEETDPRTATETIPDWERVVQIPDGVQSVASTTSQRRADIVRKWTARGGASRQFFKDLAAQFGYAIEVKDYHTFRADISGADTPIYQADTVYYWEVYSENVTPVYFRSSESGAEEPLELYQNEKLEAVITRAIPAHTHVIFTYGG